MHRDVREDLLAGHELQLVDDALVVRIGHRHEEAVAAHEDRQDAMGFGDLARHGIQMFEHDGDLREVDARHPVLLGEGAQRVHLVDRALVDELGREGSRRTGAPLRSQRGLEILLRHQLSLEQDLAERPLLVAHGPAFSLFQKRTIAFARGVYPRPFDRPPTLHMACPCGIAILLNGEPRTGGQLPVEMQVVQGQEAQAQDLAGDVEVPEVGAGKPTLATGARARLVDGARVVVPPALV